MSEGKHPRRRKRKPHRSKKKLIGPDNVAQYGDLTIAQYGRIIQMHRNVTHKKQEQLIAKWASRYSEVCTEIDHLVNDIRGLICSMDPPLLLQRIYFGLIISIHDMVSEAEYGPEQLVWSPMLEYVQSVIASTPLDPGVRSCFDDSRFDELHRKVKTLFPKLSLEFPLVQSAYRKQNEPCFEEEAEEMRVQCQMMWWGVRGCRYSYHDLPHLHDFLTPQDSVLKEAFGISAADLLKALAAMQESLLKGVFRASEEFQQFAVATTEAFEKEFGPDVSPADRPRLMQSLIQKRGWQQWQEYVFGRLLGVDLFDLGKATDLPEDFLRELSWAPGEDVDFFKPGDFCGWPLRLLPTRKRPFLASNDTFYCFDAHGLMDNFYRCVQRAVKQVAPSCAEAWNRNQKTASETISLALFDRLFQGPTVYRNVNYRWRTREGGKPDWCECDGLIVFDGHLIILEVKAGAFTYTSPATDFDAHIKSLMSLAQTPARQAQRFFEYVQSAEEVDIYDRERKKTGILRQADFREITLCCVTLDTFTTLAAKSEQLGKVGLEVPGVATWVVSIDDLRVIADIFLSPTQFCHFMEERKRAIQFGRLNAHDELDHVGLYLKHNRYVTTAERFPKESHLGWTGYRKDIDEYFHWLWCDSDKANLPTQPMPSRLAEMVCCLDREKLPGRCKVASFLLNMDGEFRRRFCDHIERAICKQLAKGRIMPLAMTGQLEAAVFCLQHAVPEPTYQWMRDYTLARVLRTETTDTLFMRLYFDAKSGIDKIRFEFVSPSDVPTNRRTQIEALSAAQAKRLVSATRSTKGEIRRNDPCPCGSGKKYKRCCAKGDSTTD